MTRRKNISNENKIEFVLVPVALSKIVLDQQESTPQIRDVDWFPGMACRATGPSCNVNKQQECMCTMCVPNVYAVHRFSACSDLTYVLVHHAQCSRAVNPNQANTHRISLGRARLQRSPAATSELVIFLSNICNPRIFAFNMQ